MNSNFADFKHKNIAVAVSGGVDSMALLYMLVDAGLKPVVLHVNHCLRDAAVAEAQYVAEIAARLGLECKIFCWGGEKTSSNLESAARDARYQMMIEYARNNGIDAILTAHQADDQIETFLMNLGRGSGVHGLAAMRSETVRDGVRIVRPLLGMFRDELQKYCDDRNIKYYVDEMNDDDRFTRVRIRKNRHLLHDKLGISDARILLAINNLSRTRDAMDDYITEKVSSVMTDGRAIFTDSFLFDEPMDIRLKLLGRIIQKVNGRDYQPRLNSLENALRSMSRDCKITLGGCTLRRLGNKIIVAVEGESVSFRKKKNGKKQTEKIF